MRRLLTLWFVLSMAYCGEAHADDAAVPPPASCASPLAEALFARVPEAARTPFFLVPPGVTDEGGSRRFEDRPPRVLELELDGRAPREAVLVLEAIRSGEQGASGAFVFACGAGAWAFVDRAVLEIDRAWDGTIDAPPGFASVTAETITGVGHELLRLEHVDLRGGVDPRFVRHRVVLVHVVDGVLVIALDVVTGDLVFGGPERETISDTTRALRRVRGRVPRYRFVFAQREEQPRRRRTCSTWLVFDGRTFVPRDAACVAR